jgi:RimJ/RimL family protein N-acetyltransferase
VTAPTIETDRLRLRGWEDRDLDPYAALCADPDVMRWIGTGEPQSRARAAAAIGEFLVGWDRQGFDLFCVADIDDDVCIGFAGLHVPDFLPEVLPAVEIGWRLARPAWGRGLGTEAGRAVVEFAFGPVGLDRLVSIARPRNRASTNIMSKLGMTLERTTVHPTLGGAVVVYDLDRPDDAPD